MSNKFLFLRMKLEEISNSSNPRTHFHSEFSAPGTRLTCMQYRSFDTLEIRTSVRTGRWANAVTPLITMKVSAARLV